MDINVNIKLDAPELAGAIQSWAAAFHEAISIYTGEADTPKRLENETESEDPSQITLDEFIAEQQSAEPPKVTLETVRAKLASLAQSGKQAEVKKLITSFGAKKLREIPKEKYPELLKKAEEL